MTKKPRTSEFSFHRFLGVSLGGGKGDRTNLTSIEYYPRVRRLVLSFIEDEIQSEGEISSDRQLFECIQKFKKKTKLVTYNVPLQLPKCIRCQLVCPGYESCQEPEILWMWDFYRRLKEYKKKLKLFTPYTQRCADLYLYRELESITEPALGSNLAPQTARAHFFRRLVKIPSIETHSIMTLYRIGKWLGMSDKDILTNKRSLESDESRERFIKTLISKKYIFIYQDDIQKMVNNGYAFDAFLCALSGFLFWRGQTEPRPTDYPEGELWIHYPKKSIQWFKSQ